MSLAAGSLTKAQHVYRVKVLYKRSLKHTLDFIVNREQWYPIAKQVRVEFEKNRMETDARTIDQKVAEVEEYLYEFQHPMPYKLPYLPGSSFFSRHSPLPVASKEELQNLVQEEMVFRKNSMELMEDNEHELANLKKLSRHD